jgi:TetR/AcrR family transcriptional repressor of nem operon
MSEGYSAKERLTYVCIQLFIRHGFNAASVNEICALTAVSKGAFFHHFKDKQQAAVAALDYAWTLFEERLAEARVEALDTSPDRINAYLDWLVQDFSDPECTMRLPGILARETGVTDTVLRAACALCYDLWEAQIVRIVAKDGHDIRNFAQELITSIEGAITLAAARSDPKIIAQAIAKLKR